MKRNTIIITIVIIIAYAGGFATGLYLTRAPKATTPKAVTIMHIAGENISHSAFSYEGPAITFRTQADGKGEIETAIPKEHVPEANAWMQRNHGILLAPHAKWTGGRLRYSADVGYLHRWNSFVIGGGISAGTYELGVFAQVQYWFDIPN